MQRFYKKEKEKKRIIVARSEMVCGYTRARGECILSFISANEASQKRGTKQPGTKLPSKRVGNTI